MRLDEYLIKEGFATDGGEALRIVKAGEVLVDEVVATSPAQNIKEASLVRVKAKKQFVSRGGQKLQGAIGHFGIDVAGKNCLDIGASTGGFTDCLLKNGAAHVAALDVNYGQLAWEIRTNPSVSVYERTNIKKVDPQTIGAPFDVIVIDVSFIGLASLAPYIYACSRKGTQLIALIKPQFESKRGETVGGVVENEEVRVRTVEEVVAAMQANGFETTGVVESPIKGPAGNIEYLLYAICAND